MSTLTTRVGGWPLSIIRDEDGAMLGHITGPVDEVPKDLRTARVQPDGQVSVMVSAFMQDVVHWQDAEVVEAQDHYQEHIGALAEAFRALRLFRIPVDARSGMRRHLNDCHRCGYWHRVILQRIGYRQAFVDKVPPTLTVPPADDDLRVAVFYKGSRVREIGIPYWSDPGPEGQRVLLVHVEAYAPWGEVLCANAPVSEVRLRPFHEVK